MDDAEVSQLFLPLWADLRPEDAFQNKKPLLAHYTTIQVLEKILTSNELWFSNPHSIERGVIGTTTKK
jgi:hypothetical protein